MPVKRGRGGRWSRENKGVISVVGSFLGGHPCVKRAEEEAAVYFYGGIMI